MNPTENDVIAPSPSASAAAVTPAPSATGAPTPAPSAAPADAVSSAGDVLLPIVVGLAPRRWRRPPSSCAEAARHSAIRVGAIAGRGGATDRWRATRGDRGTRPARAWRGSGSRSPPCSGRRPSRRPTACPPSTRARCRWPSTSRAPRRPSRSRSCSCSRATSARRRPPEGRRRPRAGADPGRPARRRPRRLGVDPGPGRSPAASSEASVAALFLWVYGWVGVAMLSALLSPRSGSGWTRSRPSTTCSPGSCASSGSEAGPSSEIPAAVRLWPAVAGLVFFVWLELVAVAGTGTLTVVLAGYTVLTLALMAQFGRDQWRAQGETFTRLVPDAQPPRDRTASSPAAQTAAARGVDPRGRGSRRRRRAPPSSGARSRPACSTRRGRSRASPWSPSASASIIFDGLSQTVAFASVFGDPALVPKTVLLLVFLAGRSSGPRCRRPRR